MLVVGDDKELGLREELLELFDEASDVGVVESRVELVEHTERSRLDHEDREEKRNRRHRALAARKKRNRLGSLTRRTRDDVDAAFERIFGVFEKHESRLAAAEKLREHRLEVGVRLFERLLEHIGRGCVQIIDEIEVRTKMREEWEKLNSDARRTFESSVIKNVLCNRCNSITEEEKHVIENALENIEKQQRAADEDNSEE